MDDEISVDQLEEALSKELDGNSQVFDNENEPEFVSYIENKSSYNIVSFTEDDGVITANIEVDSPDLYTAVNDIANTDLEDENEINQLLIQNMKEQPLLHNTVELEFLVTNNGINAVLSDYFLDAYYGGVFRLRNEAMGINSEGGEK